MARVLRTSRARQDLKDLGRYLAEESKSQVFARHFLRQIAAKCKLDARNPQLGEQRADLAPDLRCFPISSYIVFYRALEDGIDIVRVLHGSRDIPTVWRGG